MNKILLALTATLSISTFAGATIYKGIDDKGKPCALETIQPVHLEFDSEINQNKKVAIVKVNYSTFTFKAYQATDITALPDGGTKFNLNPDLSGSHGDEYQREMIVVKVNENNQPVRFHYSDNTGIIRFLSPKEAVCNLRVL